MASSVFYLGASGHQDLGNEETRQFVSQSIRTLLFTYAQQHPNRVLYAALAVEADQLFVQIALDLHIPVEAVIPHDHYEAIYPSGEEREIYYRLLKQCRAVHHMGFPNCTDDAYLAAGQWIVERSDLVILVWNGLAPKGRGGTGDVASYAWRSGCSFVQIDVRNQRIRQYHDPVGRSVQDSSLAAAVFAHQTRLYQGTTLSLDEYRVRFPI
jgi:hypothetical protein